MGRETLSSLEKVRSQRLGRKPRRYFGYGLGVQLKDIAGRRVNVRKPRPAFGRRLDDKQTALLEPSDSPELTSVLAYTPNLPAEDTQEDIGDLSSFAIYKSEIGGIPLMTSQQRFDLAQKIEKGDVGAFDRFIAGNLRLVLAIARSFEGKDLPLEDLVQAGNLGLMWAVERFDRHRKNEFSSYAIYWIEKAIREARLDSNGRGLPRHTQFELQRLDDAYSKLTQSLQREPSTEELATELGLFPARVLTLEKARRYPRSLDRKPYANSSLSFSDLLKDPTTEDPANVTVANWQRQEFEALLAEILPNPKDLLILQTRFGLDDITVSGRPPEEVAKRLNLPVEYVNTRLTGIMRRLRQPAIYTRLSEFQGLSYN